MGRRVDREQGSEREKKERSDRQEEKNDRKLLESGVPICLSAPRQENSTACMCVVPMRSPVRKRFLLCYFSIFLRKNNLKND